MPRDLEQGRDPSPARGAQPAGVAVLRPLVHQGQRDDGDPGLFDERERVGELGGRECRERAAVAADDRAREGHGPARRSRSPLQHLGLHPRLAPEHRPRDVPEARRAPVAVFVGVEVRRQPVPRGEVEEEVEQLVAVASARRPLVVGVAAVLGAADRGAEHEDLPPPDKLLSVTISIGVAEPDAHAATPAQVLKAFYRTSLGTWTALPADPAEVAALNLELVSMTVDPSFNTNTSAFTYNDIPVAA